MRAEHHSARRCATRAKGAARPAATARCVRSATDRATSSQMAGAMQFNLTCPRCQGKGRLRKRLPDLLSATGASRKPDIVEVRIPAGVQGVRGCACRARATRELWRSRGRSLHHHPGGAASVLPARRRQHRDPRPGERCRGGARREDRSADHRRTRAAEDSAGNAERTKVPACAKRAFTMPERTHAAIRL